MTTARPKVLFLCTGNSCRSQMAEGWARTLRGNVMEAFSAGLETHGINPRAVEVMGEVGVDITGQKSQLLSDLSHIDFDYVITVCSRAHETCPIFPRDAIVIHCGFDDPPALAQDAPDAAAALAPYRRVRDEIKVFVESLPESLST